MTILFGNDLMQMTCIAFNTSPEMLYEGLHNLLK